MVTASIIINQTGKPPGLPGESRDDLSLGVAVALSNEENSGVTVWSWRLLASPPSSTAGLTTPTASTCAFTPDVAGSYLIQLLLNGRIRATAIAAVKTSYLGLRIPATRETIELGGWEKAIQELIRQLEQGIQSGTFVGLTDGPGSIVSEYVPIGVIPESGPAFLENIYFGFTSLKDCPSSYSGEGGKFVRVASGESSLEFADATLDRTLVFSDDTPFAEAGGSFVTKKTFRIVRDSNKAPSSWRIVVSLWGSTSYDTAECRVNAVGTGDTDSVTLSSVFSTTETIVAGNITINDTSEPEDSFVTIQVQIRLVSGGGTANIQYTDIYAVYDEIIPE
jgi:hypothetical protein